MANIKKIEGKSGVSYQITVTTGRDSAGKQKRHWKTWKPPEKMTERQIEKAVQKVAFEFEQEITQGFIADNRQRFSEYANYVIDLKERNGAKRRTIERYRELLVRIDKAIGHLKVTDIRPQHLNQFYENLAEEGIRDSIVKATPKKDIQKLMKEKKLSAAALQRMTGTAASTFAPAIHGKTVSQKTADAISGALGCRTENLFTLEKDMRPLSPKTITEYHRLISTVMTQAEKEMLIMYNPAHKASPPKLEKKEVETFQPEEMEKILEELEQAPIKWQTIAMLLIFTGCRRGEIAGLKWECIDWENSQLYICRELNYTAKSGIFEDTPKTHDTRYVKIDRELIDQLKAYRGWFYGLRLKNGDRWVDSGYVFTRDNGECMNPDNITQWIGDFSKKVGLHVYPHKFRHSMASLMIANHVNIVTVSKRLGHAKVSTTSDIYSHAIKEADAKAADSYAEMIRRRA